MISVFAQSVIKSPHCLYIGGGMPEWASLSIKEASERSGYNAEYLRRLIRLGRIEAVKVGPSYLIRAESLERYILQTQDPNDARTGPRKKG